MFPKPRPVAFILTGLLLVLSAMAAAQVQSAKPTPKVIPLGNGTTEYVRLLGGPPDSVTMHSGAVTLQPGKTVGRHGTEDYEELIVVLEGQGSMILSGGARLDVKAGMALYCPPDTEHDILNTGSGPMRYVYVAAKVR
jgi:quercetin dioxygenase-like cupin family protein